MLGRQIDAPIEFAPYMPLPGGPASWRGMLQTLLDAAERSPGLSPLVTAELENSVMTTLLVVQPHNYRQAMTAIPSAPARAVAAAAEIMQSRQGAQLSVARIAERVGVSERSLQVAFRQQLGLSPAQYRRGARLERVRQDLAEAAPDSTSVSRIATEWGFLHLGRFAGVYRQKFGERPSQTLRRTSA
jgi:transcriptional regulator GlxA family with amidase domain